MNSRRQRPRPSTTTVPRQKWIGSTTATPAEVGEGSAVAIGDMVVGAFDATAGVLGVIIPVDTREWAPPELVPD